MEQLIAIALVIALTIGVATMKHNKPVPTDTVIKVVIKEGKLQ